MKWVALALLIAGIAAVAKALNMDATASFEKDFPLEVLTLLGGAAAVLVAVVIFGIIVFRGM